MIPNRDFRLEALADWLEVRRETFEGRPLADDVRSILEEVRRLRAAVEEKGHAGDEARRGEGYRHVEIPVGGYRRPRLDGLYDDPDKMPPLRIKRKPCYGVRDREPTPCRTAATRS